MTRVSANSVGTSTRLRTSGPTPFKEVQARACELADHISMQQAQLRRLLVDYETHEVADDETERTLDLLRSLGENRAFFDCRVGAIATFLPRNQPLYALACFVLIPAFVADAVHFRVPHTLRDFLPRLLSLLDLTRRFPNVVVAEQSRSQFLRERTALFVDPVTRERSPATDVVIFTGTPAHAAQLRGLFDRRTLFIANGAGHNPVVVAEGADLDAAAEAVVTLQLYNQGQDCAAPNAVLVHEANRDPFLARLRTALRQVRVGPYADPTVRVGPLSDPNDLPDVLAWLVAHRGWLDPAAPGALHASSGIVEPALVVKPLAAGGNFTEVFAPVIVVQPYATDADLAGYFEHSAYAQNAMYVSVFGASEYVENLVGKRIGGRLLHDATTILRDTHLHAPGVERGTQPYGGYGIGASSVSYDGRTEARPTLPQRDIWEWAQARPGARTISHPSRGESVVHKDIAKLLRLSREPADPASLPKGLYVDRNALGPSSQRYAKVLPEAAAVLLGQENAAHMATLGPEDLAPLRSVRALVEGRAGMSFSTFKATLTEAFSGTREQRRLAYRNLYLLLFGKRSGPPLAVFLWDADASEICRLLPRAA